jgi:hypothetical protein
MNKSSKSQKKLTKEQEAKRDERRAKFAAIIKQVAAMSDGEREELSERIDVHNVEGHALSIHNQMLLACQIAAPTLVGGYNQWKAQGRHVRKGESGLMIFAPTGKKNEAGEVVEDVHFLTVTVFDISQTDEDAEA